MRTTRQHRPTHHTAALLAVTLLCLGAGPALASDEHDPSTDPGEDAELDQSIDPDQEVASGSAVLDSGHVDIGPRFVDDVWTLLIHDDAAHEGDDPSVWRHPEDTVLHVGDEAILEVPGEEAYAFLGIDGGTPVHVVPQTQHPEVVWVGWNTQDPEVMETIDRGVTLSMLGVDGPGHAIVYLQSGSFDEPDVLWDSRETGPQPAWIEVNTHAHANWVFSEPGVHLARFEVAAELLDGSTVTDTQTLRFSVGDGTDPQEALAATDDPVEDGATTEPAEDEATAGPAEDDTGSADGDQVAGDDLALAAEDGAATDGSGLAPTTVFALIALAAVALAAVGTIAVLRGRAAKRQALAGRGDR